jgi:hypothetical protein
VPGRVGVSDGLLLANEAVVTSAGS